jgi:glycosyltransferase involved in cell wall biosynthesis
VSIAPILAGGGTRLKILEAMAAGRPVVATSIGAEGLQAEAGRDLLIADDPYSFANGCLALLRSPALSRRLAESARRFVRSRYDWSFVHNQVRRCYEDLAIPAHELAHTAQ